MFLYSWDEECGDCEHELYRVGMTRMKVGKNKVSKFTRVKQVTKLTEAFSNLAEKSSEDELSDVEKLPAKFRELEQSQSQESSYQLPSMNVESLLSDEDQNILEKSDILGRISVETDCKITGHDKNEFHLKSQKGTTTEIPGTNLENGKEKSGVVISRESMTEVSGINMKDELTQ